MPTHTAALIVALQHTLLILCRHTHISKMFTMTVASVA